MIKTVKFGGEKRPVLYGWAALAEFGRLTGINITSEADLGKFDIYAMLCFIYVGLKHGARLEKQRFDLDIDGVGDAMDGVVIDENDLGIFGEFLEIFKEQMPQPKKVTAP